MYSTETGKYSCDFCGFTQPEPVGKNSEPDPEHGEIWECEACGDHFCSKCFKDVATKASADGDLLLEYMLKKTGSVYCPHCFVTALADEKVDAPEGMHFLFNIALDDEDLFFDKYERRISPGDFLVHNSGIAAEVFEMTTDEGYKTLGMNVWNPDADLNHPGFKRSRNCLINFDLSKWVIITKEEQKCE